MTRQLKPSRWSQAVTLMELMVVVLIISILASIATGVYTGQTHQARIAAAHALIHNLEVAISRYEIDLGSLPPSGSGLLPIVTVTTTSLTGTGARANGSGLLHEALVHSLSSAGVTSTSAGWKGPYINFQADQIQARAGGIAQRGMIDIVDPWGNPVIYFAWPEYGYHTTDYWGGTQMFSGPAPTGAGLTLPAPNPFAATEVYYNPRTFQLFSYGPDAATLTPANNSGVSYAGAGFDDVNNFGY